MNKLDLKDKKILYELDLNCRQTNAQIAKKVGLSKDSIGYRIKKLEEKNIISSYTAVINFKKLGIIKQRILLKVIDINEKETKELLDFLKKENNIWGYGDLEGEWDYSILFLSKSSLQFNDFYQRLMGKFRNIIGDKLISELIYYDELNRDYIINIDPQREIPNKFNIEESCIIDEIDEKILKILSKNSRIKLIDLAQKLNISSMLTHQRIKKLEKKKIILQYKANLNVLELGRDYYGVKINLKNYSQKNEILNEIYSLNEMTAVLYMVGGYDIEFDLEVLNTKRYHEIINILRNKFSSIREIKSFRAIDYNISNNFPK
ncbi:MAG: AsnC family transcriptional regulator [Nanoarchaeota archaeon]|nr:AsnC family transcriptional regulator [Nanoarchaeota archaeon]